MNKQSESIKDYRRYLCSDPVPGDFKEVQLELDDMISQRTAPTNNASAQQQQGYGGTQSRPSSGNSNNNTGRQHNNASQRASFSDYAYASAQNNNGGGSYQQDYSFRRNNNNGSNGSGGSTAGQSYDYFREVSSSKSVLMCVFADRLLCNVCCIAEISTATAKLL